MSPAQLRPRTGLVASQPAPLPSSQTVLATCKGLWHFSVCRPGQAPKGQGRPGAGGSWPRPFSIASRIRFSPFLPCFAPKWGWNDVLLLGGGDPISPHGWGGHLTDPRLPPAHLRGAEPEPRQPAGGADRGCAAAGRPAAAEDPAGGRRAGEWRWARPRERGAKLPEAGRPAAERVGTQCLTKRQVSTVRSSPTAGRPGAAACTGLGSRPPPPTRCPHPCVRLAARPPPAPRRDRFSLEPAEESEPGRRGARSGCHAHVVGGPRAGTALCPIRALALSGVTHVPQALVLPSGSYFL